MRIREFEESSVRGYLHTPEKASGNGLVLTHGAGSDCRAPLLVSVADAFANVGITVLRCDLAFRQTRPHGPPPRGSAESDQEGLRRAVEVMRGMVPGRVFLGGHSYGGRQASMLAAADATVADGLLLLSYPLHPPKRGTELRTAHFSKLQVAALFVHGARDGFGTQDELAAAIRLIPARTQLLEVASAGHELLTKGNREQLPGDITEEFSKFVGG